MPSPVPVTPQPSTNSEASSTPQAPSPPGLAGSLAECLRVSPVSPGIKIKAALMLMGRNQAHMYRCLGRSPGYTKKIISAAGEGESNKLRWDIAGYFGVPVTCIWSSMNKGSQEQAA